ncbi:cache domain-containing protein [Paenibacillus sp. TAB 01]|uniref:cache domain-containing protein n=1 Tax=Paenibacillus sp. TAB 01 TaxID=3368988 RepID=UPI003751D10E
MFLLIGSIMAVCFLITYLVLQYAYTIYDEQLYSKSSQILNLSAGGIENELRKSERQSFSMATDSQIQSLLMSLKPETPEYEQYRIRSYIVDKLVQYAGYEKYIESIEVVDLLGVSTRAGVNKATTPEREQFIIDESIKGSGEMRWIYPTEADSTLIGAREIRSYENLNLNRLGTLIIRFKFDKIVDDLTAGTDLRNGEMLITSGQNTIYPLDADKRIFSDRLFNRSAQGGYFIGQWNGLSYFSTHIQSGYLGWSVLQPDSVRANFPKNYFHEKYALDRVRRQPADRPLHGGRFLPQHYEADRAAHLADEAGAARRFQPGPDRACRDGGGADG